MSDDPAIPPPSSPTLESAPPFATDAAPLPAPGSALGGRYRIDALIGAGGMGAVFRGRDLRLDRAVAVKVIRGVTAAGRERFVREARAAAALNHPHAVAVHDVGEHEGRPYLVMELVEGGSLRTAPPADLDEALRLVAQICDALEHAHDRGIVHRDLKPDNILVAGAAGARSAKIADLGLALASDDPRLTRAGGIAGTAAYMAPEQALGRRVDGRADLYALGIVLYELCTGAPPFVGEDALAVVSQHVHAPAAPLRTRRPDVAPELEQVVLRLLEKSPDRRFASAAELGAALRSIPHACTSDAAPSPLPGIGSLARGRLVGRDEEVERLRAAWERPDDHAPGLLVAGEPGAGKSRLVAALAEAAALQGATVLVGGCYELEAGTPYLPFVEALRRWVHDVEDDEALRRATADGAADLARLAPEIETRLGPLAPPPALAPNEERLRLFDHAARFLERLATRRGVLLVLEDLQWADPATLQLAHYLLRQPRTGRRLVAITYRDTELDRGHAVARSVRDWERQRLLERHPVARLSRAATGELLRTLLGQSDVAADLVSGIHAETDGNPFFVEEIVKSLVDEGRLVRDGDGWRRVESGELMLPPSVVAAIERRLARVSDDCVSALRMAAVLGKDFEFELLSAALDAGEDAALDAVEEAEAAQLVAPRGASSFVFCHDKIREVLHEGVNPVRRRRLHARALASLEAHRAAGRDVNPADLAHHALEAADHERGLVHARAAASAARAVFARDDAIRLLATALGCAEALDDRAEIIAAELELGRELLDAGELPRAVRHLERGLSLAPPEPIELQLLMALGAAQVALGDPNATATAERILARPPERLEPTALATGLLIRGRAAHVRGRVRDALPDIERAHEIASTADDVALTGRCMTFLAGSYQHAGELRTSDAWAERSRVFGERVNDPVSIALADEFRAENAIVGGRFREAEAFARREIALAREIASSERLAWALGCLAFALQGLDADDTVPAYRAAIDLAERIGERRIAMLARLGWIAAIAERGAATRAAALVGAEIREADAIGMTYFRLDARHTAALAALADRRIEDAAAMHAEYQAILDASHERSPLLVHSPTFALALAMAGRRDAALAVVAEVDALAAAQDVEHARGLCRFACAHVHAGRGESDAARAALADAVRRLEANGSIRALRWVAQWPPRT